MLFGKEHVDRYLATDGTEGHDWQGTQTLILATTGRKSGEQRLTPLIYGQQGRDYLIVASNGGAEAHPAWYFNLEANPEVGIQVWGEKRHGRARTATPEEKAAWWSIMTKEWPDYDVYQTKTDRPIPLVVIEPS